MFEKLKDYMLERHVRGLMTQYYAKFGLTLAQAKRMPMQELIRLLTNFVADNKNEVEYYAGVVKHLDEKVTTLTIENVQIREMLINNKAENKSLNTELVKLREDNYKLKLENTLYKQSGLGKDKQLNNSKAKDESLSVTR